jgi:hypothetical protein
MARARRYAFKIIVGKSGESRSVGKLGIDVRIILKCILDT